MPGRMIRRRIVFLSILLLAAIVGNGVFSTYHEYRNVEENISSEVEHRMRVSGSIRDNQLERLAIISESVREQGQKYADFLDYDKIAPVSIMLNTITRLHNLDFALLYDEDRRILASSGGVVQKGGQEVYSPLLQNGLERVGIERIPPEVVQLERQGSVEVQRGRPALAFQSVIHIKHDTGDVYAYVVLVKLINGNMELARKISKVANAEVIFYDRSNTPILTTLAGEPLPAPRNGLIHINGQPYVISSVDLLDPSGEAVGSFAVALDALPFRHHQRITMVNNLIPFLISGIICLVFLWTLRRRVFEKINTLVLALRRVGKEEADLRTRVDVRLENPSGRTVDELDTMCMDFNRMMDRLEKAHRELRMAQAASESASKAKSEFLANMSHELRTPLNHIIGFTELIVDRRVGDLNPSQEEYLRDVLASSQHLLSLINDILDLSKVEAGKLHIELSEVNLRSLLEKSLVMVKERAMKHGICFTVSDAEAPETIVADERKLKQVMYNLLSNAVKFTPDRGAVHVSAFQLSAGHGCLRRTGGTEFPIPERMTEWGSKSGDLVAFMVSDTGIGIAAEDLERIFDPFEQADSSASRQYRGTGLGLSLTRKFVELHGGKIWAESGGEGKGSRFVFAVPFLTQMQLAERR
jgi:signal transduction histidine kinase